MNLLLLLPILIPFLTAVTALLTWHNRLLQRRINVAGASLHFVAALGLLASVSRGGIQVAQIGNWPAPFGITLVADLFSAIMVTMTGLMGLTVAELVATLGADTSSFDQGLDGLLGKFAPIGGAAAAAAATAVAAIAGIGLAVLHFGGQFDDAFDSIRVGTGATGSALAGLEGDFKAVVSSVPTDFASASSAITDLNRRLGVTGQPLRKLSEQFLELSRLTGSDVSENVRLGTRLFGDWSIASKDQAGALDEVFRWAHELGPRVPPRMELMVLVHRDHEGEQAG